MSCHVRRATHFQNADFLGMGEFLVWIHRALLRSLLVYDAAIDNNRECYLTSFMCTQSWPFHFRGARPKHSYFVWQPTPLEKSTMESSPSKRRRIVTTCTECYRRKQKVLAKFYLSSCAIGSAKSGQCNRARPCNVCIARNVPEKCSYSNSATWANPSSSLSFASLCLWWASYCGRIRPS